MTSNQLPALDPTTPWYEFCSYIECCRSLNVTPSVGRFVRYNAYYKEVINSNKTEPKG